MSNQSSGFSFIVQATTACFLLNVCQWGFTPLYPDMAADLGIGPDTFSVLATLPAAMNVLLVVPVGRYVDRFGAAVFLMIGALTLAAGLVLRAQADGIGSFAVAQLVAGFAWPCFMAALVTAVLRQYSAGRTEALGWIMFAGGSGQAVGYVVLGFAGAAFGWRAASYAFAVVPLLAIPVVRGMGAALRGTTQQQVAGGMLAVLGFMLRRRVAALAAMSLTALTLGNGAIYLLPFALRDTGIDSGQTGLLIVPLIAGLLFAAPAAGRLSERHGSAAVAKAAFGLAAAGLFAFAALGTRVPVIVFSLFLMGLMSGTVTTLVPPRFVAVAERTGALGPGHAVGCARLAQALGTALGPGAAGVLYVQFGLASALSVFGALAALCIAAVAYGFEDPARN